MKIKDLMEFAPMVQYDQKPVQNQPTVGERLPEVYDPAVIARIKAAEAQPSLGTMSGDEAIAHFRRLLSTAGHGE